ncbi:MAG TPA: ABC transporter ATP-binding protein [Bacteroidota bacterium]
MEARDHTLKLIATGLSKNFNRRGIFRDISVTVAIGDSVAITGKNGSGKSTLIKILAGVLSPTAGSVRYESSGVAMGMGGVHQAMGFVAPYLQLYEEFTGLENIGLFAKMRTSRSEPPEKSEALLRRFNLWNRRNDFVRGYSSGMKQRLKYVVALVNDPRILLLDEPSANLDDEGIDAVKTVVAEQKDQSILVVATNDDREAAWCSKRIHVGT